MRIGFGTLVALGVLTAGWALAGPWTRQVETGLGRLLSNAVTADMPAGALDRPLLADWRDPAGGTDGPAIAMSENDWLKLAEDLAPVTYLPAPVEQSVPVEGEQQPL